MDKALEDRIREAIWWAEHSQFPHETHITTVDAKRLLYRLKKENADTKLVYRKDEKR